MGIMNKRQGFIYIDSKCNNGCYSCDMVNPKSSKLNIAEAIDKLQDKEEIIIIGKEPTLNKDFFGLVRNLADHFKTVSVITNGRMFAYNNFSKECKKAGLTKAYVKLFSSSKKLHDSLTRVSGSYAQTIKGIKNLERQGIKRAIIMPLIKPNHTHLSYTITTIHYLFKINEIIISFPFSMGRFSGYYEKLALDRSTFENLNFGRAFTDYSEIARAIEGRRKIKMFFSNINSSYIPDEHLTRMLEFKEVVYLDKL